MDTSEDFIKMCRKAEEIQAKWEPNIGDYHIWNDAVSIIGLSNFEGYTHVEARDKKIWGGGDYARFIVGEYKEWVLMCFDICEVPGLKKTISESIEYFKDAYRDYAHCLWLPRQDQLQDMITIDRTNLNKKYPNHVFLFDYFFGWWDSEYEYTQSFKSAEQSWLAYVMEYEYSKQWDGTDWVVE